MKKFTRVNGATHRLITDWLVAKLVPMLYNEAKWEFAAYDPFGCPHLASGVKKEGAPFWFALLLSDGRVMEQTCPRNSLLDQLQATAQRVYAINVMTFLNKELHHDGAWFVSIVGDSKMVFFWKDRDGDIQLRIESLPWHEVMTWDNGIWGEHAAQAMSLWKERLKILALKPDQLVRAAQGQMH